MTPLPQEDLANLNPQTTREWLQLLNRRFDALEESIADDRETYLNIFNELKTTNEKQDSRLEKLEVCTGQQAEAIGNLKDASKKWDITNTVLSLLAAIAAAFGLKGS